MRIEGAVALVTGASGGLGEAFLRALVARGAAKVYAAARDPAKLDGAASSDPVEPVGLDVADPARVSDAAGRARDVSLLINNAGYLAGGGALSPNAVENLRREFETNVVGPLMMARAFAPVLKANGGGAILNIASIGSFVTMPAVGTYSASKAALFALSHSLRAELRPQGTRVIVALPASIDTPMNRSGQPGASPDEIAAACLDAVESGADEVQPGGQAQELYDRWRQDPEALQAWADQFLPAS